MAITNKTLSVLLIAAIVVSVGGTFFSLMMLEASTTSPTGMAAGDVKLNVATQLSIILDDNNIDFGDCTPSTSHTIFVDSSQSDTAVDNSNCSKTGSFPDNMTVRNNGNVDADVTIKSDSDGTDLFGADGSNGFAFKAENTGNGCSGSFPTSYQNFSTIGTGSDTNLCDNLTAHDTNNSIEIYAGAWLSTQAQDGGTATWTITATQT